MNNRMVKRASNRTGNRVKSKMASRVRSRTVNRVKTKMVSKESSRTGNKEMHQMVGNSLPMDHPLRMVPRPMMLALLKIQKKTQRQQRGLHLMLSKRLTLNKHQGLNLKQTLMAMSLMVLLCASHNNRSPNNNRQLSNG